LCFAQLRAAVPRMGPERERVRKQRQSAQGCGRSPPARSDRSTLVSFVYVDYRMWLVRCRRLRASGVTASRRLHDRRGAEVIPVMFKDLRC
jgi:hypothetical protein